MSDPPKKKRKAILLAKHVQAREMAKRVLEMCVEEKRDKQLIISVKHGLDRAARYTGLSKKTLLKIEKEARLGIIRSTSEKGNLSKKNKLAINCSDRRVVHHCIEDFYLTKKISPNCSTLLSVIKQKIEFPWKEPTLRKILKLMGYKWAKCHNNQQILVEKPDLLFERSSYLRKMNEYRQINRSVYFLTETGVDGNLTFKKCWSNNLIHHTPSTDTGRLLLAYAGYRSSFMNGTKLMFEAVNAVSDNQSQTNSVNFEKWATDMLIPNLPPHSVVVLDTETKTPISVEEIPTKTSTKTVMLEWLTKNHIEASFNMRRDELFNLVESNKPPERTYKIDELLSRYGHEVWRLPQYMCDLNPIELAWTNIQANLREKFNSSPVKNLKELIEMAINELNVKDWCSIDDHIITCEANYWEKDSLMENILDTFDIDVDAKDDSDDSDSDTSPSDAN